MASFHRVFMVKLVLLFNLKIMTQEMPKEERNEGSDVKTQESTPKLHASYLAIAMGQAGMSRERAEAILKVDNNPDTRE